MVFPVCTRPHSFYAIYMQIQFRSNSPISPYTYNTRGSNSKSRILNFHPITILSPYIILYNTPRESKKKRRVHKTFKSFFSLTHSTRKKISAHVTRPGVHIRSFCGEKVLLHSKPWALSSWIVFYKLYQGTTVEYMYAHMYVRIM